MELGEISGFAFKIVGDISFNIIDSGIDFPSHDLVVDVGLV